MMKRKIIAAILFTFAGITTISQVSESAAPKSNLLSAVEPAPIMTDMMYGIGSTSKVFTAAAVMKLAAEGQIDLNAPLINYIPEFYMEDSRYQKITPQMLINHSSGLQGSSLSNTLLYGDPNSYHHDTILTQLRSQRLKADPGAYSVYCNDGFTLAEILVERISGVSFTTYLEQNFWEPMKLDRMGTSQSVNENSNLAKVYYEGITQLPYEAANVIGSGGMYASARDLSQAGQMFVSSPRAPFQILSVETRKAMEDPQFTPGYGLDESVPSTMGYGIGWDSIESPAFSAYGIKALSKGGDVKNYHAMLTVLPELNISCSVVSSGGSSSYNSLAIQEILLTYLAETGQIDRTANPQSLWDIAAVTALDHPREIPQTIRNYAGWYVGSGVFEIDFADNNTLLLRSIGTRRDTTQRYDYLGENSFISTNGDYLDATGGLVSAQAGTRGITKLVFEQEQEGIYLGMVTDEIVPGLGNAVINIPIAQRISPAFSQSGGEEVSSTDLAKEIIDGWKERDNDEYLVISEKYTASMYLDGPAIRLKTYDELPGYLGEVDGKFMTKIVDANQTRFFQKLPGQFGRDLTDLELYQSNGQDYLREKYSYISGQSVPEFDPDCEKVQIATDGMTNWFTTGTQVAAGTVTITAPETGHFYIYSYVDDHLTCVASSLLGDNDKPLYLPQNARIAFAGEAGTLFQIQAQK